ncbi:MAG TPA: NADH-quinone oxidoreductase subunit M [Aggregatilinea sp.]|jgi:NADH-quinone oxidoreductase subunit M|uniref:complex I subunit 4 family protein n=1 Tax=Aggregatilinea sp. TaxID=2806333 RepID=UPI002D10EABE|nr:NADH-quinone oxidoreductase subunit M [Aggregatilinea sp.]HML24333.1 NADH-quinone oxidoreductase subunit M [Aggregatilinea sp.]
MDRVFSGVLTGILLLPVIGAVLILLLKKESKEQARIIAAVIMGVCLLLSLGVFFGFDTDAANAAAANGQTYFAFEDNIPWIESIGVSWHLGVDGISAPMLLLTSIAGFAGVLISWGIEDRTREFMAFFLLLVAGVYGVFLAVDLFVLFFFYELAIFPMYFLIVIWGWAQTREYAAMKLTLYILIGSIVALVGVLVLYFKAGQATGIYSFDFVDLQAATKAGVFDTSFIGGASVAKVWFPAIFIGFGVLAGVFPFHNWSPDGHVAAPTAVSMIHAGVLMKLGAFAALRVGVELLPEGAKVHLPWIIFLTLINVVYGAFIAFRQRDFKYVIGFSSVSHMGLVSMGFATMNVTGMTGAGLQMFSHGVMTALFFACVGMVYDRAHTRDIPSLSGFAQKLPLVALAFMVGGFASMGMPGLSGFIAEFPIFTGLWGRPAFTPDSSGWFGSFDYYGAIAIVAALGIIVTAAYILRVVGQVFFGPFDEERYPHITPIKVYDKIALGLLVFWIIAIGVYPRLMQPMIESGIKPIVSMLGG